VSGICHGPRVSEQARRHACTSINSLHLKSQAPSPRTQNPKTNFNNRETFKHNSPGPPHTSLPPAGAAPRHRPLLLARPPLPLLPSDTPQAPPSPSPLPQRLLLLLHHLHRLPPRPDPATPPEGSPPGTLAAKLWLPGLGPPGTAPGGAGWWWRVMGSAWWGPRGVRGAAAARRVGLGLCSGSAR